MNPIGPKSLTDYLSTEMLEELERRKCRSETLSQAWREQVDASLSSHSHPTSFRSGRLSIHATSALWANRLRYQRARLVQVLQRHPVFKDLVELNVRVELSKENPVKIAGRAGKSSRSISRAAGTLLRMAAKDVEDPDLSAALQRLSDSVEKPG